MIADVVGGVVVEVAAWACAPSLAATIAVAASRFTTLGMIAGPTLISVGSFLTPTLVTIVDFFSFRTWYATTKNKATSRQKRSRMGPRAERTMWLGLAESVVINMVGEYSW